MRNKQHGFTLVETLLVLLVITMIGFTGYYVWNTQKDTNKTLDTASKITQKASSVTTKTEPGKVVIKEWNIEAPYQGSLKLEYTFHDNDRTTAWFSSKELDATGETCANSIEYGGWIVRYKADENHELEGGGSSGQTAAQYASTLPFPEYAHLGDYYYFYSHPQAACGGNQKSYDIQTETAAAVKNLLLKFETSD
jgi:prepilin-type N-terminal cleavage/methylation domain-containing protein